MAKDDQKAIEANNFHVRLKPGMARWLRRRVDEDAPSVPEVIRTIITKEQILEKDRARRQIETRRRTRARKARRP